MESSLKWLTLADTILHSHITNTYILTRNGMRFMTSWRRWNRNLIFWHFLFQTTNQEIGLIITNVTNRNKHQRPPGAKSNIVVPCNYMRYNMRKSTVDWCQEPVSPNNPENPKRLKWVKNPSTTKYLNLSLLLTCTHTPNQVTPQRLMRGTVVLSHRESRLLAEDLEVWRPKAA